MVIDGVDPARIPIHVACVMDGNGRWATQRGLKRTDGHAAGEKALFDTVEERWSSGLGWLTVYAFSTENWRRPPTRSASSWGSTSGSCSRRDELHDKGVRVRFIGRQRLASPQASSAPHRRDRVALTKRNRRMTLTFAFNYGGRAEIADAVAALVRDGVPADKVSEKAIRVGSMPPTCPTPISSCAPLASTGSRTTCSGRWPTAS